MTTNRNNYWILLIAALIVLIWIIAAIGVHTLYGQERLHTRDLTIIALYIKTKNPGMLQVLRESIAHEILIQCRLHGVPWEIITAIISVESRFNPNAVGALGEIGLMQIYTKECDGRRINPKRLYNITYNISCGICMLKEKLRIANNNLLLAIERYNGTGPGAREYREKVRTEIFELLELQIKSSTQKRGMKVLAIC